MLMDDIEVKVYRSRIKLPVIFFVPATFLLTVYVLLYLLVNSQMFVDHVFGELSESLPGNFAVSELVVEPWFVDIHAWDVAIDGRDGQRIINAHEVHARLDPLALLARRVLITKATVQDGGFDMRVEGDANTMNLLDALGQEGGPDEPEDTGPPTIKSIGLHDLACVNCYYSFWIDRLEFQVPTVTIRNGEVDIVDGVLFVRVPHAVIPKADFEFRHWLYYFPESRGNWRQSAENLTIDDWAWAGDGFTVGRVYTDIGGIEAVATGKMTFPDKVPGQDRVMTYRARGDFRIQPWSRAGQYFIQDLFHTDTRSVQIDVEGSFEEIEGEATFDIGVLDAYGIQITDLAGTAVLHDELVIIDQATGRLHGGDIALSNFYYDLYSGKFGGDAEIRDVDPMGIAADMGYDYPWLHGRASGPFSILGEIPFDEEYGVGTSPFVMLNEFLNPVVELTPTEDFTYVRTGPLDVIPGRRFRLRPGAKIWATEDRLGIDDAVIIADHARIDVDDFVFDWERYEVLRDQWDNIAQIRVQTTELGGLVADYGGSGIAGTLDARADLVGLFNYPDSTFDVRITAPRINAGGIAVVGDSLVASGRLQAGRVKLQRAAFSSPSGRATVTGWVDALRSPRGVRDEHGDMVTDYLYPRIHRADLTIDVENLDVAAAGELAGKSALELSGRASGKLALRGSLEDPIAEFDARVVNGSVMRQPLKRAEIQGTIADKSWKLDRIVIDAGPAGRLGGWLHLGFDNSLKLELSGDDIVLGRVEAIRSSGVDAGGKLDFYVHGHGTLDKPIIGGDARIVDFAVGDRELGDLALVANTIGDTTHLAGALLPWVTVELEVPLDGESAFYGRFGIDHLDLVEAIPELGRVKAIQRAEASGTVEVFLDSDFERYQVLANLSEIDVRALNKNFRNEGPIIAGLNNGELFQIQQATIGTQDRLVSIQGAVSLDQALIDVALKGDLDLSLLTGFRLSFPEYFPDSFLESRGMMTIDASVKGTPGALVAGGFLDFSPSEILLRDFAEPLQLLSGRVEFTRDGVEIPQRNPLRGRILGGVFGLTGAVQLDGMTPRNLRANVWTHNMSYRLPEVANLTFDTNLRFDAVDFDRPDTWQLSGDIDVLDGLYYENISIFQQQLTNRLIGAFSRKTERYEASVIDRFPALEEMSFNVAIRARDGFRIQNEIDRLALDLEFRIDVRLQNTLTAPRVTGEVDVIDGRVTFQGEAFEVRTGSLSFRGNPDNPFVDISAEADIFNTCRDTDVTAELAQTMSLSGVVDTGQQKSYHVILNVRGPLDTLDIQFESNPYADQRDILSLLLTGCTVDQLTASSASSPTLEVALGPVLGWIEGQVQDVVEVEEFTITPSVDRLKATVGDSISRRLSWKLQLDTGLTEVATGQRFQLEYRLSDNWSAQASESSTESSQFDSFLVDFKLKYRILLD